MKGDSLKVWEYIWLEVCDPVDDSIDKLKFMRSSKGEQLVKSAIKTNFEYHLCNSGLIEKVPKDIYDWWLNTPSPCMMQQKYKGYCDRCWDKFLNKNIAGFAPEMIIGGKK